MKLQKPKERLVSYLLVQLSNMTTSITTSGICTISASYNYLY